MVNSCIDNKKSIKHLDEFDLFRGFSIFTIVLGHIYQIFLGHMKNDSSSINRLFEYINIVGTTSYFVFISGFLFYYIFFRRGFVYKDFIKNKIKKVLCPYIIIVSGYCIFFKFVLLREYGDFSNMWHNIFFYNAYWYVPFIMIMFFLSPLFIQYINIRNQKVKILILLLSVVYSCVVCRCDHNPILSVLFWNSFYLLGIVVAENYHRILKIKSLYVLFMVWFYIDFSLYILGVNPVLSRFIHRIDCQTSLTNNVHSLLKVVQSLVYLLLFIQLNKLNNSIICFIKKCFKILAKYSFSIYFLHVYFVGLLVNDKVFYWNIISSVTSSDIGIRFCIYGLTVFICIVCIYITKFIKRYTGKYSVMVVGS